MPSDDEIVPSDDEIDTELALTIVGYDRSEQYPEWSNASMRVAYRAGWEDGALAERERPPAEVERLRTDSLLLGQANYLLAKIVAAANLSAIDGDDGFVESYNLPVGPIQKAIPFLNEQGIVVTEDGQICRGGGGEHDPECEDRGRYDRFEGVDYCAGCGAAQS